MTRITVTRSIEAPLEAVFAAVADIRVFSEVVPEIVRYEFLSGGTEGLGTRFRETRLQHGKEFSTELEITEYVENERARMVADSHGTVWDTLFTVAREGRGSTLTTVMEARSYKLLPKLLLPLVRRKIKKAVARNMDQVQVYCERMG